MDLNVQIKVITFYLKLCLLHIFPCNMFELNKWQRKEFPDSDVKVFNKIRDVILKMSSGANFIEVAVSGSILNLILYFFLLLLFLIFFILFHFYLLVCFSSLTWNL